ARRPCRKVANAKPAARASAPSSPNRYAAGTRSTIRSTTERRAALCRFALADRLVVFVAWTREAATATASGAEDGRSPEPADAPRLRLERFAVRCRDPLVDRVSSLPLPDPAVAP